MTIIKAGTGNQDAQHSTGDEMNAERGRLRCQSPALLLSCLLLTTLRVTPAAPR
eukprot:CAMPEP_0181231438 /NCGR_PEP_ID=MMETSP1096-20121128/35102_1 /TAXON_ID=156174 ORGANISM="Chrysochromulina ericina, Strain CCMP281" /NCGR_SAMPLE_ID=MMETSP1096 /ASSEMBLY_ACC=CAM_ASM_000453 /LENGTH=53 /DNA_ID=CAMNT_0023325471 /DNA_START=152 /DNA_END=309 /DNA_ORIENTATION=-